MIRQIGADRIFMLVDKLKGGRIKCPYSVSIQPKLHPNKMTATTTNLNELSHSQLESLAEDATDYLWDRNISLYSHSYVNIITQAVSYGFKVSTK